MKDEKNIFIKEDVKDNEEVVLAIKPHPWYFAKTGLVIIATIAIILLLFYKFGAGKVTSYTIFGGMIICGYLFFRNYYCWSKTHYLITNERIISYDQLSWFNKSMKEANLGDVLFMSHEIKGVMNNMLNIGSIVIRTSGVTEEELVLRNIPNPYDVEQKIAQCKKKYTGKGIKEEPEKELKPKRPIIR